MGRSVTVGRRRTMTAAGALPAPVSYEVPGVDEADVQAVLDDVIALASEPLAIGDGSGVALPPMTEGFIERQGIRMPLRRTSAAIRDRELSVMTDALSVVRDITSVLERGSTPAVAAHEQALQLAQQQSREAFELARAAVTREQPMPDIHMHLPEHNVDVTVERSEIHVPAAEQHFHAGDTHVAVPAGPAPQVDVFVPRQEPTVVNVAPAAAEVHVQPAPVFVQPAAASPTRGIRVEYDGEGNRVFVPVEVESEETT